MCKRGRGVKSRKKERKEEERWTGGGKEEEGGGKERKGKRGVWRRSRIALELEGEKERRIREKKGEERIGKERREEERIGKDLGGRKAEVSRAEERK